jgi:hypothetical protein
MTGVAVTPCRTTDIRMMTKTVAQIVSMVSNLAFPDP